MSIREKFKKKELPPATLSNEELDEMLREHFDMTIVRKRGIPKDFCETVGGIPSVDDDGETPVCYVPVFKSAETPDITILRKIKIEEA